MQNIFDVFGVITSAAIEHFLPITSLAISVLIIWPMIDGHIKVSHDLVNTLEDCGSKTSYREMSQCQQKKLEKIEHRAKVTAEYAKNVALPYHGINL